jgi:hypothetical protein
MPLWLARASHLEWPGVRGRAETPVRRARPDPVCASEGFPSHFYVKALSFGLGEDFLLALIQRLIYNALYIKFFVDVLNALDERQNTITRNSNRVGHAVPQCDGSKGYGDEGCREVNPSVLIPSDFTYRA